METDQQGAARIARTGLVAGLAAEELQRESE